MVMGESVRLGWDDVAMQCQQIAAVITRRQQVDTWQGPTAQQYRDSLDAQINALVEFSHLAESNARAAWQVGTMTGLVFRAARDSLQNLLEFIEPMQKKVGAERTETVVGEYSDVGQPVVVSDYRVFIRVSSIEPAVKELAEWFHDVVSTLDADWFEPMKQLSDELGAARSAGVVTRPDGGWPEPGLVISSKAGVGGHVRVRDLGQDAKQSSGHSEGIQLR